MKTQPDTIFSGRTWSLFGLYGLAITDSSPDKQQFLLPDVAIVAKSTMRHLGADLAADKALLGDFTDLPTRPYPSRYYHITPESYIAVSRPNRQAALARAKEVCALLTAGYVVSGSPMQIAGFTLSPSAAGWTTTSEPVFSEKEATKCNMEIQGNEMILRSSIEVSSEDLLESFKSGRRLPGPSYEWDINGSRPIVQLLSNAKKPNRFQRVVAQMAQLLTGGLATDRQTAFTLAFTTVDALLTGSGKGGSQKELERRIETLIPAQDSGKTHEILTARNNYTHRGDPITPELVLPGIALAFAVLNSCAQATTTFKEPEEFHMFLDVHRGVSTLQKLGYSIGTVVAARDEPESHEPTKDESGSKEGPPKPPDSTSGNER